MTMSAGYGDTQQHGEPGSFWRRYVWSQDHKVIAIQYSLTAIFVGLVALVLSALMRLQLGFPGQFFIHRFNALSAICYHARHDHGGVSVDRIVTWRLW